MAELHQYSPVLDVQYFPSYIYSASSLNLMSTCVLEREAYVRDNELSTFCPIFRRRDFRYTLSLVLIITR